LTVSPKVRSPGSASGGWAPLAIFPALGEAFRQQAADPAWHEHLIWLVYRGLAVGYVFIDRALEQGGEPDFFIRDPGETWNHWTTRLNVGFLEASGVPDEITSGLRGLGADAVDEWGASMGLGRGGKLKRIGAWYGQAGGELRMVQSQPDLESRTSPWRFEGFSSG
jgi:hypothetical protein